ncbi:hypothetical protein V1264_007235 [Littorina saxatilis]|uniref:Uncharacterized protein n=1 Tax=Littorina saxatilis TaxID=31220 RepID=A0AAN9AUH7_9CAEN
MAAIYILAGAMTVLLMTPNYVTSQPDQCTLAAQNVMKTCSEGASISMGNFLWFVTNGTSTNGVAPSDPATFKDQICAVEPQVTGCIFNQLGQLFKTMCSGSPQTLAAVQNFLFTYDNKCAHPCRATLIDSLRQCYVSSGLSADLFLSNRTAGHVIGSTDSEVTMFCNKRATLLGCMKPIHDSCPEALPILSTADFHLPSYEKGVTILCNHPMVYLKGLECFDEPTPLVEACVQKSQQAFLQTQIDAQAKNFSQEQFVSATCKVTIDQTDCDLKAWLKKNHEACNKAVVGLRREMECSLLPPNCTTLQKPLFDTACHEDTFNKGDRDNFQNGGSGGGSGGSGGGSGSRIASLPGALLFVLAFFFPFVKNVVV